MDYLIACSTYTNTSILAHTPKGDESKRGIDVGENPAFILQHPVQKDVVYVSTERIDEEGAVHSLRLVKKGGDAVELRPVSEIKAQGKSTCYMAVDRSGRWVRLTNYWDASVVVAPLSGARLGQVSARQFLPPTALAKMDPPFEPRCERTAAYCATHDPSREEHWAFRQRWPHAHCVVTEPYTDTSHFVVDLGEDAIYAYDFDDALGQLVCRGATVLGRHKGPRHLVFHAQRKAAYVVNELVSTVSAYKYQPPAASSDAEGGGTRLETDPTATFVLADESTTLPDDYDNAHRVCPTTGIWKAKSHAAEIRIDGDWLFVANRGHDSLSVFHLTFDEATETPKIRLAHVVPTLGKCPRNFCITSTHIVVGNQDSNHLRVFERDLVTGNLTSVSTFPQASPNFLVCLTCPAEGSAKVVGGTHQHDEEGAAEAPPPAPARCDLAAVAVGAAISAIALSAALLPE